MMLWGMCWWKSRDDSASTRTSAVALGSESGASSWSPSDSSDRSCSSRAGFVGLFRLAQVPFEGELLLLCSACFADASLGGRICRLTCLRGSSLLSALPSAGCVCGKEAIQFRLSCSQPRVPLFAGDLHHRTCVNSGGFVDSFTVVCSCLGPKKVRSFNLPGVLDCWRRQSPGRSSQQGRPVVVMVQFGPALLECWLARCLGLPTGTTFLLATGWPSIVCRMCPLHRPLRRHPILQLPTSTSPVATGRGSQLS